MKYYYTCGCIFESAHLKNLCPTCQSKDPRVIQIDRNCEDCGEVFSIIKTPEQLKLGTSKKRCPKCLPKRLKELNRNNKKQGNKFNKKEISKIKIKKHRWCTCCLEKGIEVPVAPGNYFLCSRCHKNPPEDELEIPSSNFTHKSMNEKYEYIVSKL